ncbi:hypothetical protein BH10PLA1_BH10PLA1_06850 [soil metagenome]
MKWAAVLLCLLGVAAALCAAFLVNALRIPTQVVIPTTQPSQVDEEKVQVLCATTRIPAMTVVDARWVTIKMFPKSLAPKDFVVSPVEVVGRMLSVPVAEGQTFTAACFAEKAAPKQVADAIPFGKRAVGISVTDYAGLEGMLFPGSTVDIIASFKKTDGEEDNGPTTVTLLENVQVLGIEQDTIVSSNKTLLGDSANASRGGGSMRRVTLLVDTKQAKILQAAVGTGTLSLAMRNPMDTGKANRQNISSKDLITDSSKSPVGMSDSLTKYILDAMKAASDKKEAASHGPTLFGQGDKPSTPQWDIEIIRGGQASETKSFPVAPVEPTEVVSKTDHKVGS